MSTGILHKAMRTLTTVAMMATVATVLSCNKSTTDPDPQQGPAIVFSPADNWTKAVIPSGDEGIAALQQDERGFKVWSWFQGTTSGPMFGVGGTDVKYNGSAWDYEDKKYWMNGTYDFAAVYPSTVSGTYAPETSGSTPVLKVTNFDVTDQDDLLVAFNNDIDGNNHPESVELSFQHTLANLNVQLHVAQEIIDDVIFNVIEAEVREISFYGISKKADYIEDDWTNHSTETIEIGKVLPTRVTLTGDYQTILDEGILAIPQELSESVYLYILADITLPTGQKMQKSWDFPLSGIEECPRWEKNVKYTYKAILTAEADIEFEEPSVQPWVQGESTGVIIPR